VNAKREYRQDLELAKRATGGDQAAWRELYDAGSDSLFNLLCYQVGDREAAMDLLQDTFVTAMRSIGNYRGEGPLQAWLRTIALRKSLDWRRRLARRANKHLRFLSQAPKATPAGADPSLKSEEEAIRSALESLSSNQRAAILLRELEGLSFKEVGETLGCAEATARVHCHRAGEALRKRLAGMGIMDLADGREGLRP